MPKTIVQCIIAQVADFHSKLQRYSNSKEEPHYLELVKKLDIFTLPFQKKMIFQDINYYDIFEAECIMQAFRSDENQIILAISANLKRNFFKT